MNRTPNIIQCSIYKRKTSLFDSYDSSNGGISSRYNTVYVVLDDTPDEELKDLYFDQNCLVRLRPGALPGTVIAEPIFGHKAKHTPWSFGGCYIATTDSRLTEKVNEICQHRFYGAIPLHDRQETWEMYDALSH